MRNAGFLLCCTLFLATFGARDAVAAVRNDPNADYRPGFGASDLPPKGRPFVLPAGVSIVQPIPGINMFEWEKCRNEDDGDNPPQEHGSGDSVQLCLEFRNTTGKPVTVDFPPGMIMESETTDTQNGMLVQRASIVVPAKSVHYSLLYMYCLNAPRGVSGPASRYRLGPVTEEKDFVELFELLKNKRIPAKLWDQPTNAAGAMFPANTMLQTAVSHLTSDKGLSAEDRKFIAALPNK
ncbi:hypothetical protein [Allosphingosinicella vermicomposti]|uniref:hypothetical protein n=1 Tax=Allosphingosinicella vermicomposti TaxID=614671 RepID=UPI00131A4E49|nr:hypothetical protein [Allosphingosinicella vermicomposti]